MTFVGSLECNIFAAEPFIWQRDSCNPLHNSLESCSAFCRYLHIGLWQDPKNASVIEWCVSRRGFVLHNIEQLEKQVLPEYFRHSKYSSFVRQLNMYGFHKLRTSAE